MSNNNNEQFLKVTYLDDSLKNGKINIYLAKPSPTFMFLMSEVRNILFDQHKQPTNNLRVYWIDDANDEIEVINQCDYEVFWQKCPLRHMRVAPLIEKARLTEEVNSNNEPKSSGDKTSSGNASDTNGGTYGTVHQSVTCDGCLKRPIVGFRYKCLQCRNYDLCEGCEAKHKHPEHLMIRISTWPFGDFKGGKRHHKHFSFGSECPFFFSTSATFDSGAKTTMGGHGTDKEQHKHHGSKHGRKSHRHHVQHGIFTHLYNMMQDLAEGGGPTMSDHENSSSSAENGPTENPGGGGDAGDASSHGNGFNYNDFHSAAHAAASAAAEKAATSAAAAAKAAVEATIFGFTDPADPTKSKGATPKHYKNVNIWTTPPFERTTNCSDGKTPESAQEKTGSGVDSQQASKNNDDFNRNEGSTKKPNHPVVGSPKIESAATFADPLYVKAGIQILNNFSEMFGKMLDPETNNNTTEKTTPGPNQTETPSQQSRRNSISNKTSSSHENVSTSAAAPAADTTSNINENSGENKESAAAPTDEQAKKMKEKNLTETPKTTSPTEKQSERSSSEENDWLIVDKSASSSLNSTIVNENAVDGNARVSADTSDKTEPPVVLNYVPLNKILRGLQKDQENNSTYATTAPASTIPVKTDPVAATNTDSGTGTAGNTDSNGTTIPRPAIPLPDVPRDSHVYHWDRRINEAVHGMMAMGFSNEGGWLTHLLESVNGNISQALDMMSVAQRSG